jgi:hypothetical protein
VSWGMNVHIMSWVAVESRLEKMRDYVLMQCIKESSTLRIGNKGEKLSPKIIYRLGKQDKEITNFLDKRKIINLVNIGKLS